jgi:hypothetical protein
MNLFNYAIFSKLLNPPPPRYVQRNWYVLIYGIRKGVVSCLDLTAQNERIINEFGTGKDLEGSGHGLIEVLSQHVTKGTRKNHETSQ